LKAQRFTGRKARTRKKKKKKKRKKRKAKNKKPFSESIANRLSEAADLLGRRAFVQVSRVYTSLIDESKTLAVTFVAIT
jgi:IS30 family transposase